MKKANKLIVLYLQGKRNFQDSSLKGISLKGADFSGVNFSGVDIRGTDFSESTLCNSIFTNAKAGRKMHFSIILISVSCLLLAISGIFLGFGSGWIGLFLNGKPNPRLHISAVVSILLAATFLIGVINGLSLAFRYLATAVTIAVVLLLFSISFVDIRFIHDVVVGSSFLTTFILTGSVIFIVSNSIAATVIGITGFTFIILSLFVLPFAVFTSAYLLPNLVKYGSVNLAIAVANGVNITIIATGTYITWLTLNAKGGDIWFNNIALTFAAIGGTSFQGADLTDTDFTGAILENTDFRKANLTRTCWRGVKKIDKIHPTGSYLSNAQIRQLLVTGDGEGKNFDRQDLRRLNLSRANLKNASFVDTDLYQASLRGAKLSGSLLIRTTLERANLTDACLTGACIEDWNLTRSTILNGIKCKYAFLRFVDGNKRDQVPPRNEFKEGEFIMFIKSILDTLELYHESDINPRVALVVLKSLSEQYQQPLEIVGLKKQGSGIILQVKTSELAEQNKLQEGYYFKYEQYLNLFIEEPSQFYKTLLPREEIIETRLSEVLEEVKKPRNETNIKRLYNEGLLITGGSVNMSGDYRNIRTDGGNYNENIGRDSIGKVEGNIINTTEAKTNLAEAAAEIQQLLEQLSQSNPTNSTIEKMSVAQEAIKQIESNPKLYQRVLSALKSGGIQAFEQFLNHPTASFVIGALEDWQKSKKKRC
ncbi:MAG: hypothetical protein F6J96_34805 [Symploca sp. SIO1C2]|nr:hypothetical protein [Symploca sp. SIO1C2]